MLYFFKRCIQSLRKTVYGSNFVSALAHYLLFTHFAACWEVNKIWWLKSEAGVITFLN